MRAPKGTPKGSRDMQSLRVTFHNVTSGQKAPLGRTFHNFRMRMCTPKGTPRGHVTFGTSGSHVTCTTTIVRGEKRGKRRAWAEHTSGHSSQGLFRPRDVWLRHFRSGPLPVTWLTSLPVTSLSVTSLPVAPPRSTSANVVWAVSIYYWLPILSPSMIFWVYFETVLTVWYFIFLFFQIILI
jgi:hypothetical protein